MTQANRLAMRRALDGLGVALDHVLVDGIDGALGMSCACTTVIDGDAKVACIAAASVDREGDARRAHGGARRGVSRATASRRTRATRTAEHLARAAATIGPSAIHRRSFAPCGDDPTLF